jgi:hypothetical protein
MAGTDSTLLAITSSGSVHSYAQIASRLRALEAELDPRDGLVWFNRWYAALTTALVDSTRRHRFVESVFVERLECHAADRYFDALSAHLTDPGSGPSCWEPLLQARGRPGLLPVQHVVAGINAHVNHDLPVALVSTFAELQQEPEREAPAHADYLRVGSLLEATLSDTNAWLPADAPGEIESAQNQLEAVFSIWSTKRACEGAWASAEVRWALGVSPLIAHHHLEALDRMVGLAGRSLLCPWKPSQPNPCPPDAQQPSAHIEHRPSSAPSR